MTEALLITQRVKIIIKKKFAKVALDENIEVFIVHITSLSLRQITIHLAQKAQIALLIIENINILSKYLDFIDIYLKESIVELPK